MTKTIYLDNELLDNIDMSDDMKIIGCYHDYYDKPSGQEHYRLLKYIAKNIGGHIVEIGTHCGTSAVALATATEHDVITYDIGDVKENDLSHIKNLTFRLCEFTDDVDYINAHATSTPAGDVGELGAIRNVFANRHIPAISSTKALSGHSLGAAAVNEAIFCLLMMDQNFLCASANITTLDEQANGLPIILKRIDNAKVNLVMSNSFGFGGTNATLLFRRYS